jgi:5'-nucleotidase
VTPEAPSEGWVLVTNDDGIAAPGLRALAGAAVDLGLEVVAAAPVRDSSGAGTAILAERQDDLVPVQPFELPGLDGVPAYGVAAQPAFIVFAALCGWFETPPALVLSGINAGANLAYGVMHSGTVGAALTAGRLGVPGLAVSLDSDHLPPGATVRWDTAAGMLPMALEVLAGAAKGTVLNLNVPNLPLDRLGEPKATPLAVHGRWQPEVRAVDGGIRIRGTRRSGPLEAGSDTALLAAGHPTFTPLSPITEDPNVSLADLR